MGPPLGATVVPGVGSSAGHERQGNAFHIEGHNAGGHGEIIRRICLQSLFRIVDVNGKRRAGAGFTASHGLHLIIADVGSGDQMRSDGKEPRIGFPVGGSGFRAQRTLEDIGPARRAVLHHALEQTGHDIGILRRDCLHIFRLRLVDGIAP